MAVLNDNNRFLYIDLLKLLAIFSIILNHAFLMAGDAEVLSIPIKHFQHFGNVGVAIFLMISGALLLDRDYSSYSSFLKKKGVRLILPYLFWSLIVVLSFIFISNEVIDVNFFVSQFKIFLDSGFNWYFWMILGVFCAIPVINEFIVNKKLVGASYFLKFFIIAIIIYNLLIVTNLATSLDLLFFVGPVSFLVLGYYLKNKEFNISNGLLAFIGFVCFMGLFIIRVVAFPSYDFYHIFVNIPVIRFQSFLDVSIFDVIEATGLFIFVKAIYDSSLTGVVGAIHRFLNVSVIKGFIISISKASYGMYLAHMFLIMHFIGYFKGFPLTGSQALLLVIEGAVAIFFITWILVLIVNRIPYLKIFSGYS